MKNKIQKLIAEIIGDGFTVEVKPVSGGNVSSDFGAGVTTYLSVYTDDDGGQAIYVNGKLEYFDETVYGPDVVRVADGRLVRMRSAVLSEAFDPWPENESDLKDMIDGYQAGVDAGKGSSATVTGMYYTPAGLVQIDGSKFSPVGSLQAVVVDESSTLKSGSRTVPSSPAGWSAEPDAFIGNPHHQRQPVPNGWMVLHPSSKEERREVGDRFFRVSKSHWEELTEANIQQANFQNWAAIRKIPSEVVDSSELLGSKPQYREPTQADLANGPIEVEVCDDGDLDGLWPTRKLYAVLPKQFEYPFIVATRHNDSCITHYKHARIKVS